MPKFTVLEVQEETRLNRWLYTDIEADDGRAALEIAMDGGDTPN